MIFNSVAVSTAINIPVSDQLYNKSLDISNSVTTLKSLLQLQSIPFELVHPQMLRVYTPIRPVWDLLARLGMDILQLSNNCFQVNKPALTSTPVLLTREYQTCCEVHDITGYRDSILSVLHGVGVLGAEATTEVFPFKSTIKFTCPYRSDLEVALSSNSIIPNIFYHAKGLDKYTYACDEIIQLSHYLDCRFQSHCIDIRINPPR